MSVYQYHGIFEEINKLYAAEIIKKHWNTFRYNPCYKLCYIVEMRKIDELYSDIGVDNLMNLKKNTPDFTTMRVENRKKDFIKSLEETKKYLKANKLKLDFYIKRRSKFPWLGNSPNIKWKLKKYK